MAAPTDIPQPHRPATDLTAPSTPKAPARADRATMRQRAARAAAMRHPRQGNSMTYTNSGAPSGRAGGLACLALIACLALVAPSQAASLAPELLPAIQAATF